MLQAWCREHDVVFILDEIQANFGRTGRMYAFEKYGLEPDIVCLGKGMGNGVPVSAAVGRRDVFGSLTYGEGSDTWSANPLACAAVVATLDEFDEQQIVEKSQELSRRLQEGLLGLRESGGIRHVRGEGVVFGIECSERHGKSAAEIANAVVLEAYRGRGEVGVHLLGPLAGKVIRVSPPLTMTLDEADESLAILREAVERVAQGG